MKMISSLIILVAGAGLLSAQTPVGPAPSPKILIPTNFAVPSPEMINQNLAILVEAQGAKGGEKSFTQIGCGPVWEMELDKPTIHFSFRLLDASKAACRLEYVVLAVSDTGDAHSFRLAGQAIFNYGESVTLVAGSGKSLAVTVNTVGEPMAFEETSQSGPVVPPPPMPPQSKKTPPRPPSIVPGAPPRVPPPSSFIEEE